VCRFFPNNEHVRSYTHAQDQDTIPTHSAFTRFKHTFQVKCAHSSSGSFRSHDNDNKDKDDKDTSKGKSREDKDHTRHEHENALLSASSQLHRVTIDLDNTSIGPRTAVKLCELLSIGFIDYKNYYKMIRRRKSSRSSSSNSSKDDNKSGTEKERESRRHGDDDDDDSNSSNTNNSKIKENKDKKKKRKDENKQEEEEEKPANVGAISALLYSIQSRQTASRYKDARLRDVNTLIISNNTIGDEGAQMIAQLMCNNKNIVKVNVSANEISKEGMACFGEGICMYVIV